MDIDDIQKAKYYKNLSRRFNIAKKIVENRRSCFSLWEWIQLKDIFNIKEENY